MQLDCGICTLRPWQHGDEAALVRHANSREIWLNLRDQFPYPYSAEDAASWVRFASAESPPRRFAIVVEEAVVADEDQLLGWVHVEHRVSLEGGERAELMGLVVDSTVRRQGWGKALLDAAESWALAQGLSTLTVRSNVARHSSHPFYESFGYTRSKTQHVYAKKLKSSSDAHRA